MSPVLVEPCLYDPANKANESDRVDDQHITMGIHSVQLRSVRREYSLMTSQQPIVECALSVIAGFMATRWRHISDSNGAFQY